jgi:Family of unknown function (DUF5677)
VEGDTRRAEQTIERLVSDVESLTDLNVPAAKAAAGLLGYGWWLRCVRTADAIRLLHKSGLGQEASPLVRTLIHHELALLWLESSPDEALEAVTYLWVPKTRPVP